MLNASFATDEALRDVYPIHHIGITHWSLSQIVSLFGREEGTSRKSLGNCFGVDVATDRVPFATYNHHQPHLARLSPIGYRNTTITAAIPHIILRFPLSTRFSDTTSDTGPRISPGLFFSPPFTLAPCRYTRVALPITRSHFQRNASIHHLEVVDL